MSPNRLVAACHLPDDGRTMSTAPTTAEDQALEVKELTRVLSAMAQSAGQGFSAREHYERKWGPKTANMSAPMVLKAFDWVEKAAVGAGTSTDATWAAPLATSRVSTGFLTQVRRESVLGK